MDETSSADSMQVVIDCVKTVRHVVGVSFLVPGAASHALFMKNPPASASAPVFPFELVRADLEIVEKYLAHLVIIALTSMDHNVSDIRIEFGKYAGQTNDFRPRTEDCHHLQGILFSAHGSNFFSKCIGIIWVEYLTCPYQKLHLRNSDVLYIMGPPNSHFNYLWFTSGNPVLPDLIRAPIAQADERLSLNNTKQLPFSSMEVVPANHARFGS